METLVVGFDDILMRRTLLQEYSIDGDRLQKRISALSYDENETTEIDATCTIVYTRQKVGATAHRFVV